MRPCEGGHLTHRKKKWQSGDVQSSGHERADRVALGENLLASVSDVSWDGLGCGRAAQTGM